MIVRLSLLAACAVLAVSPALAKDKSGAKSEQVACAGVYGADSSEALLIETFGKDNVVTGTIYGPEGIEMIGTTVFPNDPDRKMEFVWWDEVALADLSFVDLAPSQTGPAGVRIGQSVAEVVALNGKPFVIGGFWWDYGGYANIETGNLAGQQGDCYISIRFAPADDYPETLDTTPVAGEVQVPSDAPLLETLDVRVAVVSISYPGVEGDE